MKKKTLLIGTIASLFAIGTMVIANPHHKKRHAGFDGREMHEPSAERIMKRLSKLDLSEEQSNEIEALVKDGIDSSKAQRESLKGLHQQMKAMMNADTIDESGIKATSSEIANLKSDLMIARLNKRKQIESILTDEQNAKMEKMKEHRKMKKSRQGRKAKKERN